MRVLRVSGGLMVVVRAGGDNEVAAMRGGLCGCPVRRWLRFRRAATEEVPLSLGWDQWLSGSCWLLLPGHGDGPEPVEGFELGGVALGRVVRLPSPPRSPPRRAP